MNVEAHGGDGVEPQPLLQHLADSHDGLGLGGVRQPHRQLVRPGADVHHSSVNLENNIAKSEENPWNSSKRGYEVMGVNLAILSRFTSCVPGKRAGLRALR